jgi:hypothetical protein
VVLHHPLSVYHFTYTKIRNIARFGQVYPGLTFTNLTSSFLLYMPVLAALVGGKVSRYSLL